MPIKRSPGWMPLVDAMPESQVSGSSESQVSQVGKCVERVRYIKSASWHELSKAGDGRRAISSCITREGRTGDPDHDAKWLAIVAEHEADLGGGEPSVISVVVLVMALE